MTEHDHPVALPASMALAWGVTETAKRGPKRALTIDAIVRAGVAVAVDDGLPAVSMARVAERLGVSTMALYRYVASKDDLLELMVDSALGLPDDPDPAAPWRVGMRSWAQRCRDRYRANQWALRVPISAPPLGPNNVRWLECALYAMRDTPLTAQDKVSCVVTIAGIIRSEELLYADLMDSRSAGRDPLDYGRALMSVIDPVEFPQIVAAFETGAMSDDEDDDFEFGIERILDGIEALIHTRAGA